VSTIQAENLFEEVLGLRATLPLALLLEVEHLPLGPAPCLY
jgi:hypothetical protein